MSMNEIRRLGYGSALLGLGIALTAGCGDPPSGPPDFFGQLRIRPVFLAGNAPDQVGVSIDSMAVRLRNEISRTLSVDTVVAYEEGASLSWVLELESEDDPVTVQLSLLRLTEILYMGDRELVVREGTIGAAPLEDVAVHFQGADAERVEVTPGQAILDRPGLTQQFVATVYDNDGDPIGGRTFTWSSSATSVAEIDENGLATSVGNGTTLIIASVAGVADTATLTAYAIESIVVQPAETTLTGIGSTAQLTATAFDADGNAVPGVVFDWSTVDAAVASVDSSGLVTATGGGAAQIVAAAGGVADTARVTVTQGIERIEVTPDAALLQDAGTTVQLTAMAYDANSHAIAGASFAWSSSDAAVASVDASGLVTAISRGIAGIVATGEGRADTAVVGVAVRDSVTYAFDLVIIMARIGKTEATLGSFTVPAHVPELGVAVQVDMELSFDEQRDEAFAVGTLESGQVEFLGDPACPIVEDDGTLGRGWLPVAMAPIEAGVRTFIARHAVEFPCYEGNGDDGSNSVHFHGIRFVYYTTQ